MSQAPSLLPHKVNLEKRPDGTLLLTSGYDTGPVARSTCEWLKHWAAKTPEQIFLAEPGPDGWRECTYAQVLAEVQAIATGLLERGLKPGDRLAILSGNSVDHALITLACQYIGAVSIPVAEQYSLIPGARDRLVYIVEKTTPSMLYTDNAERYDAALNLPELVSIPVVASHAGGTTRDVILMQDLCATVPTETAEEAYAAVGPDTLAKILFTSGSTSQPKGVVTTHEMMCVNQAQISASLPFLKERPPKIVDWLPWNHVFGGSHNFNMMLANGGALYIDDGKPVKGLFDNTLRNLGEHTGTLSFNVPAGWAMVLSALRNDAELRKRFFNGLDMIFYAGASLPQEVWDGLQELALAETGRIPLMTSSWGMTETAPAVLLQHEETDRSGVIGAPVPAAEIKLIPDEEMRCELRVRGPNIMKAYYEDPAKTAESFDEEGFLITGDAVRFLDPKNPNAGLVFDGRISEDFKLLTGTWVQSAKIRAAALTALAGLAQDVVVTGHGRDQIGLLIFPAGDALAGLDAAAQSNVAITDEELTSRVRSALQALASSATGSSNKICRALLVSDPPSIEHHEITAKGNLNIRKVLDNRKDFVERLYDDSDPATITI